MATTKLKLKILAKDILENDYCESSVCPITRALKRAGRKDLEDVGEIKNIKKDIFLINFDNETYYQLLLKLFGMFSKKEGYNFRLNGKEIPATNIEDFEHELIFEE